MTEIVKSVQIEETLSEEKGQYVSAFYYRLAKELGVGVDLETGEPTEAYCVYTIEHKNPINYDHFHQKVIRWELSQQGECDENLIIPITKAEYDEAMKEEEAEQHD